MMVYRHGENPDFKGFYWNLLWIIWCAFFAGRAVALEDWLSFGIQSGCLALWIGWTVYRLRTMTWNALEVTVPTVKEEKE